MPKVKQAACERIAVPPDFPHPRLKLQALWLLLRHTEVYFSKVKETFKISIY